MSGGSPPARAAAARGRFRRGRAAARSRRGMAAALLALLALAAAGCGPRARPAEPAAAPAAEPARPSPADGGTAPAAGGDAAPPRAGEAGSTVPQVRDEVARVLADVDRVDYVHALGRLGGSVTGAQARRLVELLSAGVEPYDGTPPQCYGELELVLYAGKRFVGAARADGSGCAALLRVGPLYGTERVLRLRPTPEGLALLERLAAPLRPAPVGGETPPPAVPGVELSAWRPWVAAPGVEARAYADWPEPLEPLAWLDDRTALGHSGGELLLDRDGGARRTGLRAVDARPAPDGREVLVRDGEGLALWRRADGSLVRLPARGRTGELLQGGLWSPDGRRLLVWEQHEWDAAFYLLDPQQPQRAPAVLDTRAEGYFLAEAAGWLSDDRVLFTTRAARRRDGTREYSHGFRSDLAAYDLAAGTYRLLTQAQDGEFLASVPLDSGRAPLLPDGRVLVRRTWRDGREEHQWTSIDVAAGAPAAVHASLRPVPGVPPGAWPVVPCPDGGMWYVLRDLRDGRATRLYRGAMPGTARQSLFYLPPGGAPVPLLDGLADGTVQPALRVAPSCRHALVVLSYAEAVDPLWTSFRTRHRAVLVELPAGR